MSTNKTNSEPAPADHYYSSRPSVESRQSVVVYSLPGNAAPPLEFITDRGVFSKSRVDFGTDLLIRSLPPLSGRLLDLGCGFGAVGISLALMNPGAEVWLSDINERAVKLCVENYSRIMSMRGAGGRTEIIEKLICDEKTTCGKTITCNEKMLYDDKITCNEKMLCDEKTLFNKKIICSDGFMNLGDTLFDTVVSNPPIRTGKANVFRLYADVYAHLNNGGALYIVIQKKQGLDSTVKELTCLFGNCEDIARKAGYHVIKSTKLTGASTV